MEIAMKKFSAANELIVDSVVKWLQALDQYNFGLRKLYYDPRQNYYDCNGTVAKSFKNYLQIYVSSFNYSAKTTYTAENRQGEKGWKFVNLLCKMKIWREFIFYFAGFCVLMWFDMIFIFYRRLFFLLYPWRFCYKEQDSHLNQGDGTPRTFR